VINFSDSHIKSVCWTEIAAIICSTLLNYFAPVSLSKVNTIKIKFSGAPLGTFVMKELFLSGVLSKIELKSLQTIFKLLHLQRLFL